MKKISFIFLFFILFTDTAVAQFRVGPLAGLAMSRFVYEDTEVRKMYKTRTQPAYHVGVQLNYRVNKLYSLQTELSFLHKGIDVRYQDEFVEVHNSAGFQYLSVPVLLRFSKHKKIQSQHVEFYVNVGPEVNYWLGGRGKLKTSEQANFVKENELSYRVSFEEGQEFGNHMVVKEPLRFQMGIGAGGGLIFDLGKTQNFALDFRTSFGIGKSFHGNENGGQYGLNFYGENLEGVHHTISITASYLANFDLDVLFRKGKMIR